MKCISHDIGSTRASSTERYIRLKRTLSTICWSAKIDDPNQESLLSKLSELDRFNGSVEESILLLGEIGYDLRGKGNFSNSYFYTGNTRQTSYRAFLKEDDFSAIAAVSNNIVGFEKIYSALQANLGYGPLYNYQNQAEQVVLIARIAKIHASLGNGFTIEDTINAIIYMGHSGHVTGLSPAKKLWKKASSFFGFSGYESQGLNESDLERIEFFVRNKKFQAQEITQPEKNTLNYSPYSAQTKVHEAGFKTRHSKGGLYREWLGFFDSVLGIDEYSMQTRKAWA